MKHPHLVPRKNGSKTYFHFRGRIPQDLIPTFSGRKEFQISLKNVSNIDTLLVSIYLQPLIEELFNEIRMGMKTITLEDIREILKVEVRKSILHSHHVHLGTNKFDPNKLEQSLVSVSSRENKMKQELAQDLKKYDRELDKKLENIFNDLDIKFDTNSVNYKQLKRNFIELYLLRFEFIRNLINETGVTDDDFRLEVQEKLKTNLFSELVEQTIPQVPTVSKPSQVQEQLSPHQSTPLSIGIENYMNEKGSIRTRSVKEVEHSLNMMIEEWGDIGIGSITREMGTHFKSHLLKLPRNRKKNPEYRDKDLHELVEMNIKDTISSTTVNKHLQYVSSFYEWSVNHGYATINPFKGMKLKRTVRPRDERDRFTELELKKIFGRDNYIHYTNIGDYIHYTNVEKGKYAFAYYWVPLIAVFSGMRLGEICPLYLDNVRIIEGHHRKRRWCFDILEEPNRTDKRLKNQSSRRVVPIHDILIEQLGFIEFIELLKKKDPKRERLFQELLYREGNYNKNVSTFFNKRYLPSLGLKTDKKNFHSFRHTVSDHLKQKGIEPHFINELLGHSTGNIDLERYGKGYNPDIIYNKCVKKISYQTSQKRWIDFKSLKMDWGKIIE